MATNSSDPVDHDDLRAFLAVVEHASFTRAAKALGAPKSSVSKRVASLEARVGVALLARTTRSVAVTAAGRALAAEVSVALAAISNAVDRTRRDAETPRGRVRVTAPLVFGDELLAPLIAPFLAANPDVQVDLLLSDRRVDMIADGIDVAIRAGPMVDSTLVVRRLGPAESVLVGSPAYLRKHGVPKRMEELEGHRWCLFSSSGAVSQKLTLRGPRGSGTVELRATLTTTSQLALRRCVLDGAGLAVMPWYLARRSLEEGSLVEVLPKHRAPVGQLQLLTAAGRATGAVKAFVSMVSEAFREARPWVREDRAP